MLIVSLLTYLDFFAQTPIKSNEPNIMLKPAQVEASSTYPPQTSTYEAAHLLDGKDETAWFNAREDVKPWIVFTFGMPVRIQALIVKNGWWKGNNWNINCRAKELDLSVSDGSRYAWILRDDQSIQILPGLAVPTNTFKFSILSSYQNNPLTGTKNKFTEIGLSEISFAGRIVTKDTLTFRDLSRCTLEILAPITIASNQLRAKSILSDQVVLLNPGPMNGEIPGYDPLEDRLNCSFQAPSSSPNERVVKAGRKFVVVNIISRPDKDLSLVCEDGTTFVLSNERFIDISPHYYFGNLNMAELNYIFAGQIRFLDPKGITKVDY